MEKTLEVKVEKNIFKDYGNLWSESIKLTRMHAKSYLIVTAIMIGAELACCAAPALIDSAKGFVEGVKARKQMSCMDDDPFDSEEE